MLEGGHISPPAIRPLELNEKCILDIDVCDNHTGGVLVQEEKNGRIRPVGYYSCEPTGKKPELDTTDKPCLARFWKATVL